MTNARIKLISITICTMSIIAEDKYVSNTTECNLFSMNMLRQNVLRRLCSRPLSLMIKITMRI